MTSHELVQDSTRILRDVAELLKAAADPELQDTEIIDQMVVVIDDMADQQLTMGKA